MAVEIPAEYLDYSLWLVRTGGLLEPILNGVDQNISRLGDRLQIDITAMPQDLTGEGMAFLSRLFDAADDEALIAWPNDGMPRTGAGAVTVDGAVAANAIVLPIKGATPGFVFKEGLWFAILRAGRRYMHRVRGGDQTVPGTGKLNLLIGPRLRTAMVNNDALEIAAPKIQGNVLGDRHGWSQASGSHSAPVSFSIRERK